MTGESESQRAQPPAPVDDRYTALRVDDELLIYDHEEDGAWIQSTETCELRA
ncbi:hypothetical protein EGH21_12145 [Halomicroarcula sp. F13]|uniref:Uncharacterized protein n=1 Tax=Haloarcula rubra TaxID=2487747 RepID=A0AAW4PT94_9EURY|nr:hypothetical protein [Halomicroarcula rubra]MBX0323780.1 hypothetical protein [Halomicroarcula rubra]